VESAKNLYIVTGFLGSGKTTFLNRWLESFENRPIALVINEFGAVDVDGALFDPSRFDIAKISNGSILCSCRSDRFIEVMESLAKASVTDVIVETSGISDISILGKVLGTINQLTKDAYCYKGLITVADCTRIRKTASVSLPVKSQLAYADYILLNKTDLCTEEETEEVLSFIRRINPLCPIEKTNYGIAKNPKKLLDLEVFRKLPVNMKDVVSPWPDKFTCFFQRKISVDRLEALVDFLISHALRVKGFVDTDEGFRFVDAVPGSVKTSEYKFHDFSFLTVIYEHETPLKLLTKKKGVDLFGPEILKIE
jgi:G3E family GTPase